MKTESVFSREELEQIIKETVAECTKADGWANLAVIGAALRKKGVKYGKLSKFFSSYSNLVDLKVDETVTPPVAYAKLKVEVLQS